MRATNARLLQVGIQETCEMLDSFTYAGMIALHELPSWQRTVTVGIYSVPPNF